MGCAGARSSPAIDDDGDDIALHPVGVDTWGGFLFVHLSPAAAAAAGEPARPGRRAGAAVPARRAPPRRHVHLRRRRQLEGARRELQRVLPLRSRPPGAVRPDPRVPPRRRRAGVGSRASRTATARGRSPPPGHRPRAPFPDLDDAERTRHKGELVYPNLLLSLAAEHVAASTLRPHGPARTTVVCDLLFHPDEIASDTLRSRPTPPSCGTSSTGQDWAICESVQRGMSSRAWQGGWFAPMEDESADISRWYLRPRWAMSRSHRRLQPLRRPHQTCAVVGLGGIGSAAAYWLARRGATVTGFEQFELGHARGASHDHSRIIRRSYHTRGLRRADRGCVRRLGGGRARGRARHRHPHGRHRPVPARRRDRPPRLHGEPRRRRCAVRLDRRRRGQAALAGVRRRARRRRVDGALPGRHRHRPGGPGDRDAPTPRVRAAAPGCVRTRRCGRSGRSAERSTWSPTTGTERFDAVVLALRRVGQPAARPARPRHPAGRAARAGQLLPRRRPRPVPAGAVPGVDLDGRPVLLRVPGVRRPHRGEGGRGLRRARGRSRRRAPSTRTPRPRTGWPGSCAGWSGTRSPARRVRRPACTR